jgi:hypothetical protein
MDDVTSAVYRDGVEAAGIDEALGDSFFPVSIFLTLKRLM